MDTIAPGSRIPGLGRSLLGGRKSIVVSTGAPKETQPRANERRSRSRGSSNSNDQSRNLAQLEQQEAMQASSSQPYMNPERQNYIRQCQHDKRLIDSYRPPPQGPTERVPARNHGLERSKGQDQPFVDHKRKRISDQHSAAKNPRLTSNGEQLHRRQYMQHRGNQVSAFDAPTESWRQTAASGRFMPRHGTRDQIPWQQHSDQTNHDVNAASRSDTHQQALPKHTHFDDSGTSDVTTAADFVAALHGQQTVPTDETTLPHTRNSVSVPIFVDRASTSVKGEVPPEDTVGNLLLKGQATSEFEYQAASGEEQGEEEPRYLDVPSPWEGHGSKKTWKGLDRAEQQRLWSNYRHLTNHSQQIRKQFEIGKQKRAEYDQSLKEAEHGKKQAQDQLEQALESRHELENSLRSKTEEQQILERRIEHLTEQVVALEATNMQASGTFKQSSHAEEKQNQQEAEKTIHNLTSEKQRLHKNVEELNQKISDLESDNTISEDNLQAAKEAKREARQNVKSLEKEQKRLKDRIEELSNECIVLRNEIPNRVQKEEYQRRAREVESLRARLAEFEAESGGDLKKLTKRGKELEKMQELLETEKEHKRIFRRKHASDKETIAKLEALLDYEKKNRKDSEKKLRREVEKQGTLKLKLAETTKKLKRATTVEAEEDEQMLENAESDAEQSDGIDDESKESTRGKTHSEERKSRSRSAGHQEAAKPQTSNRKVKRDSVKVRTRSGKERKRG